MKWLVWLALGALVYFALRVQAKRNRMRRGNAQSNMNDATNNAKNNAQTRRPAGSAKTAETMVECSYCQTYVPISEAISSTVDNQTNSQFDRRYFCSEEHARLYSNLTENQASSIKNESK